MTGHKFAEGSRFSGDTEVIKVELERIAHERGQLRAEYVVEVGRDEDSPLHLREFLWDDDDRAAHEYRLEVARRLIRAVVIDKGKGQDDGPRVWVYVGDGYATVADTVANPSRYAQALAAALADLESAQRRMHDLLTAAKATKGKKADVAYITLAIEALQTAREAIHPLH